ncbi:MAG TPA: hypothetical protein DDZ67_04905 [Xanthomonadaceae bacterium]|nr:hypothetical protein [Xanthomonadaceae bacterium]
MWSTGTDVAIADDRPLEYDTIAEFLAKLPERDDVELDQEASQGPGTALYTTSRAKVMAEIMAPNPTGPFLRRPTVTNWIFFTSPHPFAPSLLRIHATEIADEATHTSHMLKRVAVLCEARPDACHLLRAKTEESLSVSLPSPRTTPASPPR